jgi:Ca-activated chloride channel family protein
MNAVAGGVGQSHCHRRPLSPSRMVMKRLAPIAMLLAVCGAARVAGSRQEMPPVLSARTDLVTLAVTVVDRYGARVGGLRAEHFTVYDGGETRAIQFFSSGGLPATVGLLIDSSGSMRGHRRQVTAAASAFTVMGNEGDEFFTLNFNDVVWPGLPPRVAFTRNRELLQAALAAAPAQGMTALYDAVDRGLSQLESGSRDRRALIIVSDGGDNASARTRSDVLAHARRASAVIYSVSILDPDNREGRADVLKALARETGGRAHTASGGEDVDRAFDDIAAEIRSGYTIGFVPVQAANAGFRPIRVVVDTGDRRRLTARTRAGYYAEPPAAPSP